ncbi:hypothetical protein EJB05_52976 [Eragrostis curvula]|uniref:DNA topoisomerase (ATP-hydrolyzing) n=1 Tax=Eragrostis curvula TaxID=38414 RepID=A0A5J9SRE3_9POAL|nr:hypothetical protein EJB05_52976 [Eragrostis curvula]
MGQDGTATESMTGSRVNEFENHIVAQDMEPEDVYKIIKDIMASQAQIIIHGEDGEDIFFEIPKRGRKYMDHSHSSTIPLLRAGNNSIRSFIHDRTTHDYCMTIWVMMVITEIIANRVTITELELYHMNEVLFDNKQTVDRILNDICCMIRCKRRSLNVVSAQRGSVVGDISMRMNNGRVVECSEVALIPNDTRKISEIMVNKNATEIKFILIVQTEFMFQHLQKMKFHTLQHCIIVTACGVPDFSTLEFIQLLKLTINLPIYALTDPDPLGIKTLTVYARGSIKTAQENFNLAIPDIQWLGISTLDYEDFGLVLNCQNSVALSQTEIKRLSDLLTDEYLQLPDVWKKRIRHIVDSKRKMCYEDLHFYGCEFAAKTFLPWLIDRLREPRRPSCVINI